MMVLGRGGWMGGNNENNIVSYYGLPSTVIYCRRCVISNQRPNSAVEFRHTINSRKSTIEFNSDGVCSACVAAEQKRGINWDERRGMLMDLCNRFRGCNGVGNYDCLVPGSGGKDSFYQAWVLKYEFGMTPLTVTWAPNLYTEWGWANHRAWVDAGFDNILVTPNGRVHSLLTRLAVEKLFHPFQPFILGQKNLAPKVALRYNIPLIFYGENEAEYGNPLCDLATSLRDARYYAYSDFDNLYISGISVRELITEWGLTLADLNLYMPVNIDLFERVIRDGGLQVHYMGYYLRWHPQGNYYFAVNKSDGRWQCSPERTPGTYSKYNSIDDMIDDYHYWTTYIKFGLGRASYDASQEIRNGDITRDEGVALVRRFDGEWPDRFWPQVSRYLTVYKDIWPLAYSRLESPIMDKEYIMSLADKFRSPHLWDGRRLRYCVS